MLFKLILDLISCAFAAPFVALYSMAPGNFHLVSFVACCERSPQGVIEMQCGLFDFSSMLTNAAPPESNAKMENKDKRVKRQICKKKKKGCVERKAGQQKADHRYK